MASSSSFEPLNESGSYRLSDDDGNDTYSHRSNIRERSPSEENRLYKAPRLSPNNVDHEEIVIVPTIKPVRRRVAKKTTVTKVLQTPSNTIKTNQSLISRTRIRTVSPVTVRNNDYEQEIDDDYNEYEEDEDENPRSQQILPSDEGFGLCRIPVPPLLPTFSDKVKHNLMIGNPDPIMNELIREAADFYMNVYPQLTHGVEYKKIGIALINEYPCLACDDTINPHGLITSRLSARIRNVRRKMRTREMKCAVRGTIY
ncbi:unnamed protein product [Didymodactylos carnosus]|uniref:Uncharacterized protein n=1 Tax=Didymodactylos carnosus TaxID=1234261 RepID=A0A814MQY2_9BILA|nr:unnamed protein product [Didymodactylos carnosus]CAF1152396.1 unnamed protein product [Didymodactylos carnosus]CAF3847469.1 unnamed protein product [Didymodactylos carnosus]CAF3960807.1 unnamed protein product [Didymodactylos carnosus]